MEAYPLELYVATRLGAARYLPAGHRLEQLTTSDLRAELRAAAHDQDSITSAPAVFLLAAVYGRLIDKLGPGCEPFVHMDLGHAAQNLLLQAAALGLVGVPIAWLEPEAVSRAAGLPKDHVPLYLVPVGLADS
jgi:SagB-type dehydrogenase family enzyme